MIPDTEPAELSIVARYGLAAALACGAMLVRAVLPMGLSLGIYPLALAIVVLSAWYGGRGPGWLATLVSAAGARYFFIEPTHSFAIPSAATAVGLLLFVGVALLLIELSMARRRAKKALAESDRRFRSMAEKLRTSEEHWKQVFENSQAKVAAEELRYKTQLLATITDNMAGMLQMVDAEGRAIYVNAATERITGYRAEELIGQVLHEKLHHSHPDGTPYPSNECPLNGVFESKTPVRCEEFFVRKDGTFIPVSCSSSPIFHDGVLRGVVTEIQDLTERNKADHALAEMRAELAHVARRSTMGELAASIAHGINQPLAAIVADASASLRWLGANPSNVDEARQAVARIVKEGTRAGEIISGIRALLKKAPAERVPVDLNQAIAEVVALMRTEAQKRRVKLDVRLSTDVPPVHGDRVGLQQVILNLVLNGLEAAGAAAEGPRELVVSSETHAGNGVQVSVRDTGVGFDGSSAARLFDAFYTTKEGGMGLGLAISRSIVEAHRGRIWAEPNAPRGAVFRVTLPGVTRAP